MSVASTASDVPDLRRRAMRDEDPAALAGRLRLGREEFCQRLLTTLILGGTYPKWNASVMKLA